MDVTSLIYIDASGYHYADYPTFQLFYTTAFQNIYGADTYLGPDSQDGQWLGIVAQSAYDMASVGAQIYNSWSPQSAIGTALSNVVLINGISRNISSFSTVELTLIGVNGTALVNAIALDILNQQWLIPNTLIPESGTITVTATAALTGAVQAAPDSITMIFTPVLGWQSVNNSAVATVGAGVETDAALRSRQANSVANPSVSLFDGTLGAVGNVLGVIEYVGYENDTNETDGNGLPPHSISIVVEGGSDSAIANAIAVHKTPGTQTYGTTSVSTVDSRGMPLLINFYRPTVATIGVQITITPLANFNSSTIALIQAAVSSYITGLSIGADIVLTQLYGVAYLVGTPVAGTFNIEGSIELKKNSGGFSASDIQLLFNEIPISVSSNIVVIT